MQAIQARSIALLFVIGGVVRQAMPSVAFAQVETSLSEKQVASFPTWGTMSLAIASVFSESRGIGTIDH